MSCFPRMQVLVDAPHPDWPGLHSGRVWFQAPEVDGITYVSGPGVVPGALVECADRTSDTVLLHTFDLDELRDMRLSWGVFRDRRPEMYGRIAGISGLK